MRNIWTIFRKELYRVFSDRRLILMIFILPGVSIFAMYWLIGTLIHNQMEAVREHTIVIYEEHMPATVRANLESLADLDDPITFSFLDDETYDLATLKDLVREGDIDIALVFEADFEAKIDDYHIDDPPVVDILHNYGRQHSSFAYNTVSSVLETYRSDKLLDRLENPDHALIFASVYHADDIVDERRIAGQGLAMLLPFLTIIFLFSAAMSIGPDSIAGEKERGTVATLLITPIKRSEIAIGKVVSLGLLTLASAISSFIGIVLSLPRLMQADTNNIDYAIYGVAEMLLILFTLMATVLIIVGLIAVISAYARTIKEASMLIMPFYLVTMIIGIMSSFGTEPSQSLWVHFIPIYGAVNFLNGVFVFDYAVANFVVVVATSVLYTTAFVVLLTRLFNSEKVMFQK